MRCYIRRVFYVVVTVLLIQLVGQLVYLMRQPRPQRKPARRSLASRDSGDQSWGTCNNKVCLFSHLPASLSLSLSVCLSIYLFIYLSIYLSIYLCIYLFIYLFYDCFTDISVSKMVDFSASISDQMSHMICHSRTTETCRCCY